MREFVRGDLAVGVGRLPGRLSVRVTVRRGGVVYTVAYCRNDDEADRLMNAIGELLGFDKEELRDERTQRAQ